MTIYETRFDAEGVYAAALADRHAAAKAYYGEMFDEQIADGMLDLGPLGRTFLAIGQLLCRAEMFHGCLELDPFLRGEARQFQRLDNLGRLGSPDLLRFFHGLQCQAFGFKIVLRDIGSVSPFVTGSVRRAL